MLNPTLQRWLKPLASLRLTVALLVCAMILIFAGTWAQIDRGIWDVQKTYFHSFFTWIQFQLFLPRPKAGETGIPGGFPMLGGYSLIVLLLLNLLAAHTVRFKLTKKRTGIIFIHAGLILLILGEVVASLYQVEGQMTLKEGESKSYTYDLRAAELAIIDGSPADRDIVTVIPASMLRRGATISDPSIPFSIHVEDFFKNTTFLGPFQAQQQKIKSLATAGEARAVVALAAPEFSGTSAEASSVNVPSAYISLKAGQKDLGIYLASVGLNGEQTVEVDGKTYRLSLRFQREYKPYTINLVDFRHDKFTGTETARNFSSQVRLNDASHAETRETIIRMNEPLRYRGETIFQSGFDRDDPTVTTLMIVRNPGWLIPYISCSMVALGMLIHFGTILVPFLRRSAEGKIVAGVPVARTSARPLIPLLGTVGCALYLMLTIAPPHVNSEFDLSAFGRIPLSYEGRVMPMDSLARNSLRIISGRSQFTEDGESKPATQWLLDTFANPQRMTKHVVIRIDHPDIKNLLKLDASRKLFSYTELAPGLPKVDEQLKLLQQTRKQDWNSYQRQIDELAQHILLIQRLAGVETLYLAPPMQKGEDWTTFAQATQNAKKGSPNPAAAAFDAMLSAYFNNNAAAFNSAAGSSLATFTQNMPAVLDRASFEVVFNHAAPFYQLMILYVLVFLLICGSWLVWRGTLQRTAYWILLLTLVYHTIALAVRIYLSGRPPVTNLYSSAIFIAWAAAIFCAFLERIYRNGIGTLAASVVAFPSLLIAHYLAGSGDTMEMLQAVLDTNFWLATHVVVITLGYSATFLAGILAVIYVVGGVFTPLLAPEDSRKALARMIYGILCFAMLFSFVGTILGGIWADQSWGRFWGWDPKENGAALIVVWNAIVLHARWAGIVQARGMALLAIFGNAVTSFSWFGTNMLGIGLHSYGFMESALFWLGAFVISQLALIALGCVPTDLWRSFNKRTNPEPPPRRGGKPALAR